MQELRARSPGTLIAEAHGQKRINVTNHRRCMMYKNSALLSIGAALLFSLFFINVGHAFQIEKRQDARILMAGEMKGTASLPTKQVSNTPIPCGGRTGATCWKQGPQGSGATATDGSRYTNASLLVPLSAAGILFGAGFIALVGLGASRLRHNHEHHA